jgi:hypothetical protein
MGMHRVIITKYRVYELDPDAQGIPIMEYFKNAKLDALPEPFRRAKVYDTPDGPVIALPDQPKPPEPS